MYFLFGALAGLIVGFMKAEIVTWFVVGAGLGFLVGLFFENKTIRTKIKPEKSMWLGFFLLSPIIFFSDYLKPTFWYDVFGILAVIGAFTLIVNFIKMLGKKK